MEKGNVHMKPLSGWQRIGLILLVLSATSIPFALAPIAKQNYDACYAVSHPQRPITFTWHYGEGGDAVKGGETTFDPASGEGGQPRTPPPMLCLDGYEGAFALTDYRNYPLSLKAGLGDFAGVMLLWLVFFGIEFLVAAAVLWLMASMLMRLAGWVKDGFQPST